MGVTQPKKRLTKNEIIEILRRNARLFKNEPDFVAYIVDLGIYLIENMLEQGESKKTPVPFQASPNEIKSVHQVFERFAADRLQKRTCPMCGCPTEGKRKCPNCDAMTF
jgi:hypothetical protein